MSANETERPPHEEPQPAAEAPLGPFAPSVGSPVMESSPTDSLTESASEPSSRSRPRLESLKLDRTLQELESAFSDWESLSSAKPSGKSPSPQAQEQEAEFKKRTKKLLSELREQLRDL